MMNYELRAYRRARRQFAIKTYIFFIVWLLLALVQWMIVCMIQEARNMFRELYYICFTTFALAICLFTVFIFCEKLRYVKGINFVISFVIVELQIISLFGLVVYSWWADVLAFFALCALVIILCLMIGSILPRRVDLTLDVAVIFIVAFIFLMVAVFCLMFFIFVWSTVPYTYIVVELSISITIMFFVMYHAQTIHGNRFAEMRLDDYLLGSLILFHDFLIIYWLTFYWQILYRVVTSDDYIATSTNATSTTAQFTKSTKPSGRNIDIFDDLDSGRRRNRFHNRRKHKGRDDDENDERDRYDDRVDYTDQPREPEGDREYDRYPKRYPDRRHDRDDERTEESDWSVYRNRHKHRPYDDRPRNRDLHRGRSRNRYPNRPTSDIANNNWQLAKPNKDRNIYDNEDTYHESNFWPEQKKRGPDQQFPDRKDIEFEDDWLTTYDDRDDIVPLQTEEKMMPLGDNIKISPQPGNEFGYELQEGAKITENPVNVLTESARDHIERVPEIDEEFRDEIEVSSSDNDEGIYEELIDEEILTTDDVSEMEAYEKLLLTNLNKSTRKFDL